MRTKQDSVSESEVRALLERHRGQWQTIAQRVGISYSWISKFVNRRIDNPGHRTLIRLRDSMAPRRARRQPARR